MPEQERHRRLLRVGALCEVVAGTNCVGAASTRIICVGEEKIIQTECIQIRTSNVVQDSIKCTYDTIILWLHTTINRTYNVIVPKNKSQKMPIQILNIPSVTKRNQWPNCSN